MAKKSDYASKPILIRLLILIPAFYVLSYVIASIFIASLGLPYYGDLPFDHVHFGFDTTRSLASFLAFTTTFLLFSILIIVVGRSTKLAWDYAVTISILHFVLSCIVMRAFPLNWIWWLDIALGTFLVVLISELLCYWCIDSRSIKAENL
eukprot:gnl/Trimastix_PCT/4417.p1 GENE.gnl/Trimastix_PCT/4417~~gnl/Trimastix_PCT/4417.p1  ORF type:complete len:150 (+),score=16.79 gnl/Trimastix_PCT/4417:79-528(+)